MKRPPKIKDYNMADIDLMEVASTMECTGIVPSAPDSREGLENRLELMHFSPVDADEFSKDFE